MVWWFADDWRGAGRNEGLGEGFRGARVYRQGSRRGRYIPHETRSGATCDYRRQSRECAMDGQFAGASFRQAALGRFPRRTFCRRRDPTLREKLARANSAASRVEVMLTSNDLAARWVIRGVFSVRSDLSQSSSLHPITVAISNLLVGPFAKGRAPSCGAFQK